MKTTHCTKVRICMVAMAVHAALPLAATARESKSALAPDAVLQKLQQTFGKDSVYQVLPSTTLKGWYEVLTPNELAYANSDGTLVFAGGKIIDVNTRKDLTAERWNELNRIDVAHLPLDNAIKIVKGNGERVLYLFSDPDCPFCQQLETQLKDVTNITIYTFLYPLEVIHPEARAKANALWCSSDRARVWQEWMLNRVLPSASCDQHVVDDNLTLGARYKINSTPTLFFADGQRVTGALDKDQLEQVFAAQRQP